jgi:hypothetical protein
MSARSGASPKETSSDADLARLRALLTSPEMQQVSAMWTRERQYLRNSLLEFHQLAGDVFHHYWLSLSATAAQQPSTGTSSPSSFSSCTPGAQESVIIRERSDKRRSDGGDGDRQENADEHTPAAAAKVQKPSDRREAPAAAQSVDRAEQTHAAEMRLAQQAELQVRAAMLLTALEDCSEGVGNDLLWITCPELVAVRRSVLTWIDELERSEEQREEGAEQQQKHQEGHERKEGASEEAEKKPTHRKDDTEKEETAEETVQTMEETTVQTMEETTEETVQTIEKEGQPERADRESGSAQAEQRADHKVESVLTEHQRVTALLPDPTEDVIRILSLYQAAVQESENGPEWVDRSVLLRGLGIAGGRALTTQHRLALSQLLLVRSCCVLKFCLSLTLLYGAAASDQCLDSDEEPSP